jgi:DNA-binding NarL/FixJ family response regulator
MSVAPLRVAVADDAFLFREGLCLLLKAADVQVTHQVGDGDTLIERLAQDVPDVAILDIRMPPHPDGGLVTAERLRARHPDLGILVLSQYAETPHLTRLLALGASGMGFRLKDRVADVHVLRDTLARIVAGDTVIEPELVDRLLAVRRTPARRSAITQLTDRELDILTAMAEGHSNESIGSLLRLSVKTVENHIARIFTKLGLPPSDTSQHRRVAAVLAYLRSQPDR